MDMIFKWAMNKFKDYVLRNWQTTLVGVLGGVLTQVPALAPHKDTIVAAVLALLGILAKSATTTGTIEQPRTPPEVVAAQKQAVAVGLSANEVVYGVGERPPPEVLRYKPEGE